jgi:hypothetical protein
LVCQIDIYSQYLSSCNSGQQRKAKALSLGEFMKVATISFPELTTSMPVNDKGMQKLMLKGIKPLKQLPEANGSLELADFLVDTAVMSDVGSNALVDAVAMDVDGNIVEVQNSPVESPEDAPAESSKLPANVDAQDDESERATSEIHFANGGSPVEIQSQVPMEVENESGVACLWQECGTFHADEKSLLDHILQLHMPPGKSGYECCWKSCRRFSSDNKPPTKSRSVAFAHFKTHGPFIDNLSMDKLRSLIRSRATSMDPSPSMQPSPALPNATGSTASTPELSGIPLTTALVLRNLARAKVNHPLFLPYERDLTIMTTSNVGGLAKVVSAILSELK